MKCNLKNAKSEKKAIQIVINLPDGSKKELETTSFFLVTKNAEGMNVSEHWNAGDSENLIYTLSNVTNEKVEKYLLQQLASAGSAPAEESAKPKPKKE